MLENYIKWKYTIITTLEKKTTNDKTWRTIRIMFDSQIF